MTVQTIELRRLARDLRGNVPVSATLVPSALEAAADKIEQLISAIGTMQEVIESRTRVADERSDAANRSLDRARKAEALAEDRLKALLAAAELAGQLVREVRGD